MTLDGLYRSVLSWQSFPSPCRLCVQAEPKGKAKPEAKGKAKAEGKGKAKPEAKGKAKAKAKVEANCWHGRHSEHLLMAGPCFDVFFDVFLFCYALFKDSIMMGSSGTIILIIFLYLNFHIVPGIFPGTQIWGFRSPPISEAEPKAKAKALLEWKTLEKSRKRIGKAVCREGVAGEKHVRKFNGKFHRLLVEIHCQFLVDQRWSQSQSRWHNSSVHYLWSSPVSETTFADGFNSAGCCFFAGNLFMQMMAKLFPSIMAVLP